LLASALPKCVGFLLDEVPALVERRHDKSP
jgi:hypothetical protein